MKLASFKALDECHHWTDAQKLVCVMVTPEAPDVKSFCFKTADDSWFRYLPGQFITLELPVNDEKLLRTYTLSSSPSRHLAISVTVKAQPDRSEEHTSELQSLMRISYDVFCLKTTQTIQTTTTVLTEY